MNFSQAENVLINGKTVQQITLNDKVIYQSGPTITLTSLKEYIIPSETVTINLVSEDLSNTNIEFYKVINMTRTLLDTLTTDENGEATYVYTGEGAGEIGFVAVYNEKSSNTLKVDDYVPEMYNIDLISSSYSYDYDSPVTFTAIATDQHGQPISGKTILFKDGNNLLGTKTTDSNGVATLSNSRLDAGTHIITASSSQVSSAISVNVNKLSTNLTISVPALIYSDIFDVTGVLTDSNDVPIKNTTVTLSWNDGSDHTATATTDNNGEVTFHRDAPTSIRDYTFQLQFEGGTNYNASNSIVVERTVGKETSVLNITSPTSPVTVTDSSFDVVGVLTDDDGTPIKGKWIEAYFDGVYPYVAHTTTSLVDGSFTMTIPTSSLSDGQHSLRINYNATSTYTSANAYLTVVKSSFDGITVSSDKTILSKADNEYATLTAQLTLNDSPVAISGETVTFEIRKKSDDSLVETLSGSTNSSGIASVTYQSQGVGDVNVNVTCRLLTKTFTVHDYYGYRETGSQAHNTGSTQHFYPLFDLTNIGDCEITGEISATTNKGFSVGFNKSSDWTDDNFARCMVDGAGYDGSYCKVNGNNQYSNYSTTYTANTYFAFKFKYENGVLTLTHKSRDWTPQVPLEPCNFGFGGWNSNKTINYRNLIIKKL